MAALVLPGARGSGEVEDTAFCCEKAATHLPAGNIYASPLEFLKAFTPDLRKVSLYPISIMAL